MRTSCRCVSDVICSTGLSINQQMNLSFSYKSYPFPKMHFGVINIFCCEEKNVTSVETLLQSISRMTETQNAPCGVDTHIHLIVTFRCVLLMAWMDVIILCSIVDKQLLGKSGFIPLVFSADG